jgi:hypothetical protein
MIDAKSHGPLMAAWRQMTSDGPTLALTPSDSMSNVPYGESIRYVPATTPLAFIRMRRNTCGGDPAPFGNAASSAKAVETVPPAIGTSLETPRQ